MNSLYSFASVPHLSERGALPTRLNNAGGVAHAVKRINPNRTLDGLSMLAYRPQPFAWKIFDYKFLVLALLLGGFSQRAEAQIVPPTGVVERDAVASLEDQLINRLRATEEQQRGYIRRVTRLVRQGRLEQRLVVAIYRYAIQRSPVYPFPYFERAIRYEAKKRGVLLPPVQLVARTPGEVRSLR